MRHMKAFQDTGTRTIFFFFFFRNPALCISKVLRCAARKTQLSYKLKHIILYWVILTPQTQTPQKTLGKSESICIRLQLLSSLWIHWADVCLAISIKPLRRESALNVNEVTTPQGRVALLRLQLNELDTLIRMWCLPSLLLSACVALTSLCFYIYVVFFFLFNQMRFFQKHLASHCRARELLSQLLLLSVFSCALSLYFPLLLPLLLLLLLSSWWRASLPGLSSSRQSLLLHLHHPPSLLPTAALCQPCCPGAALTSSSHPVPSSPPSHTFATLAASRMCLPWKSPQILHLCLLTLCFFCGFILLLLCVLQWFVEKHTWATLCFWIASCWWRNALNVALDSGAL